MSSGLPLLATAYFRQDWDLVAESADEVLREFRTGISAESVDEAIPALTAALGSSDEYALRQL